MAGPQSIAEPAFHFTGEITARFLTLKTSPFIAHTFAHIL